MSTTPPAQNAFCLVHGDPEVPPGFIEGPFATANEAELNAEADRKAYPNIPVVIHNLTNPANC